MAMIQECSKGIEKIELKPKKTLNTGGGTSTTSSPNKPKVAAVCHVDLTKKEELEWDNEETKQSPTKVEGGES